jgi:hypothetical protein
MGQRAASTSEAKALKSLVPVWAYLSEGLSLADGTPSILGFHNHIYGKLLCPVTQDWLSHKYDFDILAFLSLLTVLATGSSSP